jgi:peptidoglycan/LPS O-acetylase OafA/YrhL
VQTIDKLQGAPAAAAGAHHHLSALDGWRGFSILAVLAAHLLPLGPNRWNQNTNVGIFGMVIFFNLSGFLITSALLKDRNIPAFLIKRFCRVLPLGWLCLAIALISVGAAPSVFLSHFLFYANLPPSDLISITAHTWSLCVEVQFYVGVAILVALFRKNGLFMLPAIGLFFTAVRISQGVYASSISYYRIDEILAGCMLALVYQEHFGSKLKAMMASIPQWPLVIVLVISCLPQGQWLNYLRPYLAAALIGATLLNPDTSLNRFLRLGSLKFLAAISYALYIIHPLLVHSWLGSGDTLEKYAKRPLLFICLFILAYISTYFYERWFINYGARLAKSFKPKRPRPAMLDSIAEKDTLERLK